MRKILISSLAAFFVTLLCYLIFLSIGDNAKSDRREAQMNSIESFGQEKFFSLAKEFAMKNGKYEKYDCYFAADGTDRMIESWTYFSRQDKFSIRLEHNWVSEKDVVSNRDEQWNLKTGTEEYSQKNQWIGATLYYETPASGKPFCEIYDGFDLDRVLKIVTR